MVKINPYLNFMGKSEEAFNFYKSVFGGEFTMLQRFKDVAELPNKDKMSAEDMEKIMHVSLPIGETVLMATDALESIGQTLTFGNNISLSLDIEKREEADRIFGALFEGGHVDVPMTEMFWGSYWGMGDDRYGIKWMLNCPKN